MLAHRTALDIPRRDTVYAKILYHLREQLASDFSRAVIFVPKKCPHLIHRREVWGLDMPHFSIHKLRHYFASKMSAMNIPEADIMRMGGWETDHVMKSVYRHSMMEKEETAKREAAEKLGNVLFSGK